VLAAPPAMLPPLACSQRSRDGFHLNHTDACNHHVRYSAQAIDYTSTQIPTQEQLEPAASRAADPPPLTPEQQVSAAKAVGHQQAGVVTATAW
jgi:hypothetical protein